MHTITGEGNVSCEATFITFLMRQMPDFCAVQPLHWFLHYGVATLPHYKWCLFHVSQPAVCVVFQLL
jgi:hypothetical protein